MPVESAADPVVGPGVWVTLVYHLYDEEDALVESSDEAGCIEALFGYGQLSPALERLLNGARVGEVCDTQLAAGEAFGDRVREKIIEIARAELPKDIRLGDEFSADHEDGLLVSLTVLEVTDESVVLDTNHPLAGQKVRIEVVVEAARIASTAEIAKAERRLAVEPSTSGLIPTSRLKKPRFS